MEYWPKHVSETLWIKCIIYILKCICWLFIYFRILDVFGDVGCIVILDCLLLSQDLFWTDIASCVQWNKGTSIYGMFEISNYAKLFANFMCMVIPWSAREDWWDLVVYHGCLVFLSCPVFYHRYPVRYIISFSWSSYKAAIVSIFLSQF